MICKSLHHCIAKFCCPSWHDFLVLSPKQATFSHQHFSISSQSLSGFHICKNASTSLSAMDQAWTISISMGRISKTLTLRHTWQKVITALPQTWKSAQYPCQPLGFPCVRHFFHPLEHIFSDICYTFYYFLESIHFLAFMFPRIKSLFYIHIFFYHF